MWQRILVSAIALFFVQQAVFCQVGQRCWTYKNSYTYGYMEGNVLKTSSICVYDPSAQIDPFDPSKKIVLYPTPNSGLRDIFGNDIPSYFPICLRFDEQSWNELFMSDNGIICQMTGSSNPTLANIQTCIQTACDDWNSICESIQFVSLCNAAFDLDHQIQIGGNFDPVFWQSSTGVMNTTSYKVQQKMYDATIQYIPYLSCGDPRFITRIEFNALLPSQKCWAFTIACPIENTVYEKCFTAQYHNGTAVLPISICQVFKHEMGHLMGLGHTCTSGLESAQNPATWSIMNPTTLAIGSSFTIQKCQDYIQLKETDRCAICKKYCPQECDRAVDIKVIPMTEANDLIRLEVYPVPSERYVNITVLRNTKEDAVMTIYDIRGRLIAKKEITQTDGSVNGGAELRLSSLGRGVYIVRVVCGNQYDMKKIIIQ